MEPYDLSTLPHRRAADHRARPAASARSRSASGSAPARGTRPTRAPGVSHFIEHLLFKGTRTHTAQEIAEIFDGLGGELNAATSRETHRRLRPRPRRPPRDGARRDGGHGLRADLRRPRRRARGRARGDRDGRGHAAGPRPRPALGGGLRRRSARPARDRPRRGDLDASRKRSLAAYHRQMYAARTSSSRPPGNLEHDRAARAARARGAPAHEPPEARTRVRKPLVKRAAARAPLPAQGHRAVPRLHRRARHLAHRPAPLRRLAARRDPRRLGLVAALPGDPREARHGVLGLQLRLAVHRHRPDRPLRRHARGEPRECLEIVAARDRGHRRRQRPATRELERAKENLKGRILLSMESTSNRMSRLGKSLITDTELLSLDRIIAEIDAVDGGRGRRARGRAAARAATRLSAARDRPDEERFRAAVERRQSRRLAARAAA